MPRFFSVVLTREGKGGRRDLGVWCEGRFVDCFGRVLLEGKQRDVSNIKEARCCFFHAFGLVCSCLVWRRLVFSDEETRSDG